MSVQIEISKLEKLLNMLECLREEWSLNAQGIEMAFGHDCPPAKAIRHCIGELNKVAKKF